MRIAENRQRPEASSTSVASNPRTSGAGIPIPASPIAITALFHLTSPSRLVVEAKAGLRERTHLRVGDGDMVRMRRVSLERRFALEGRVEHRVGVRAREPLDAHRDVDETGNLSLQSLEAILDAALYGRLVDDLVLQFPQYDVLDHFLLLTEIQRFPFFAARDSYPGRLAPADPTQTRPPSVPSPSTCRPSNTSSRSACSSLRS